jgi:hypothetical protein
MTPVLVGAAVVATVVLVGIAVAVRTRAAFDERFPPISDAEFLARCKPGTRPEVALKVRRLVADHFAVEYDRVHPSTRFVGDLGAD